MSDAERDVDQRAGAGPASSDETGPALRRRDGSVARRWLPWGLMAVVVGACLAVGLGGGAEPQTNADRVLDLSSSISCPVCDGQSVAESDVAISREIRRDVANRVEQGQTDETILEAYAERYGEGVLLTPSAEGVTGIVWVVPVVALVAALAGLAVAFRRWSGPARHATAADEALVADALAHDADDPPPTP